MDKCFDGGDFCTGSIVAGRALAERNGLVPEISPGGSEVGGLENKLEGTQSILRKESLSLESMDLKNIAISLTA